MEDSTIKTLFLTLIIGAFISIAWIMTTYMIVSLEIEYTKQLCIKNPQTCSMSESKDKEG